MFEGGSPSKMSKTSAEDGELPLAEYEVLSASSEAPGEVKYVVKKRAREDGPLLCWRARRWRDPDPRALTRTRRGAVALSALSDARLLRLRRILFHSPSETLYIVTDHAAGLTLADHIERCKSSSLRFRENFIWSVLYGAASACEALHALRPDGWRFEFDPRRTYVGADCKIIFDPFTPAIQDDSGAANPKCSSLLCKIGHILYQMSTLTEYTEQSYQTMKCSKDLSEIVDKLLHVGPDSNCQLTYNILLYHPTVLSHLDNSKEMFEKNVPPAVTGPLNDSAFESDESLKSDISGLKLPTFDASKLSHDSSDAGRFENRTVTESDFSPTLVALDLNLPGYKPRRTADNSNKWKSRLDLCKEPKEVSEYALSKVWLDRLQTLQKREEELKLKEKEVAKQEIFNIVRSKVLEDAASSDQIGNIPPNSLPGITIKTAMADKILCGESRNDSACFPELKDIDIELNCQLNPRVKSQKPQTLYKRPPRKSNTKLRSRKRMPLNYEDMDSSLSADPGDNSFLPTSSKLSAEIIPRPNNICNNLRRKVHFNNRNNPFAEYDSISSTTFTFFDIENLGNSSYETPTILPPASESIAERISKFTYLDLEDLTNKKRSLMEQTRKSPTKAKSNSQLNATFATKSPRNRLNRKTKYTSPRLITSSQLNIYNSNASESSGMSVTSYPCAGRVKDRRKSMPFLPPPNRTVQNVPTKPETDHSINQSNDNEIMTRSKSLRRSCRNAIFNNRFSLALSKKSVCDEPLSINNNDKKDGNKENYQTPSVNKSKDNKRKSILGFKTPFKLNL